MTNGTLPPLSPSTPPTILPSRSTVTSSPPLCPRGGERVKVEPLIKAEATGKNYYGRWKMEGGIYMCRLNLLIINKGLILHLNSHFMNFLFEHLSHYIFEITSQFSFFGFLT